MARLLDRANNKQMQLFSVGWKNTWTERRKIDKILGSVSPLRHPFTKQSECYLFEIFFSYEYIAVETWPYFGDNRNMSILLEMQQ